MNGIKSASLSKCGKYRWVLQRGECKKPLVFLMLNPSTADADLDDPTIRRCMGFAETLGYDGIRVVNLYSYRATSPLELKTVDDPVGEMTNAHILHAMKRARFVVCAWGNHAKDDRVKEVVALLQAKHIKTKCLGVNKNNSPKHPLYLSKNAELIDWNL